MVYTVTFCSFIFIRRNTFFRLIDNREIGRIPVAPQTVEIYALRIIRLTKILDWCSNTSQRNSTILYALSNVDIYDEITAASNRNGLLLEESVA